MSTSLVFFMLLSMTIIFGHIFFGHIIIGHEEVVSKSDGKECVNCPDFVRKTAKEKQELIFRRAMSHASNKTFPSSWPISALGVFLVSMDTPFDRFADELPRDRTRVIHARGALAQVRFVPTSNSFNLTGVYRHGAPHGVIRLSLARNAPPFIPGFGLKFFIDSQLSTNLIGMFALEGQGTDYNFFRNQLKTRIPTPRTPIFVANAAITIGLKRFESGGKPATELNADQPSFLEPDGSSVSEPRFPQAVYLIPNPTLRKSISSKPHDFRKDLVTIPTNSLLYTMYGTMNARQCDRCGKYKDDPCPDIFKVEGCNVEELGQIYTTSPFVVSEYVDDGIFFQHSRVIYKPRMTCIYDTARDDSKKDSTVLPIWKNSLGECRAGSKCPRDATSSSKSGCPFDDKVRPG